ncbi:MAG TPA: phospholipid carrier-dependent glycosyltransferase [Rhodospirillales bacterium]|nr:phospholipid carrier-dependent glycosyltransferase [Rhodospirillales bacterium]
MTPSSTPFSRATRCFRGSRDRPLITPRHHKPGEDNRVLLTVLISLLTLTTFVGLFVFRSLDDNRLTSWWWTFAGTDIFSVFLVLTAGIVAAYAVSRISFPRRGRAAMLFVASFAAAALFWGEPEVIIDAARYFMQAKHLELYGPGYFFGEWGKGVAAWTDLPLVPFLQGLVLTLFGETRIAVQGFTTLLFSATVALTYLIGRTLWDEITGAGAGALLLAMPYLLTQPPLMLVDVPTMFFLTLAVYATIKGVRDGGAFFLAAAPVAITLALLSKYSTWVMLSVVPVIFLVHLDLGRRTVLRRAAIISLGALLLAGAAVSMKAGVFADQIKLLWSYQVPGLARWGESHASTFLFQIHPFVTGAAIFSIFAAVAKRDVKYAIIGWMLFLIMALGIRRARYALVTFPMLALMAAYGLRRIADGKTRRFIISCAVVSSLVTAHFGFLPFLKGTSAVNLMRAGEYLDSLDVEKAEVITLPRTRSIINPAIAVPILDLFTGKQILHQGNLEPPARNLIETSPLRFTWEFKTPPYFAPGPEIPGDDTALVVIASRAGQPLPPRIAQRLAGYRLSKEFAVTDKVFKFKTIVGVYLLP